MSPSQHSPADPHLDPGYPPDPVATDRPDAPARPKPIEQPRGAPVLEPDRDDDRGPGHRLPSWADARSVALLAAVLVVLAGYWWWDGRPATREIPAGPRAQASQPAAAIAPGGDDASVKVPGPATPTQSGASAPAAASAIDPPGTAGSDSSTVTVDVRGGVRERGVHVLPRGSRVMDAIEAAGGLRPGKSYGSLNLAEVLADGQQVIVGRSRAAGPGRAARTAPVPGGSAAAPGTIPAAAPINLNTAGAAELQGLPGVGPVLAERIVAWREQNGGFSSLGDLLKVSGIGDKVLSGLADAATVK